MGFVLEVDDLLTGKNELFHVQQCFQVLEMVPVLGR